MLNVKIGDLANKYETSGRGVSFISDGMGGDDPGGISYGAYQLETKKGTMEEYLKSSYSGKYGLLLSQYNINTIAFKNEWGKLAQEEPEDFNYSQFLFICNKPGGYLEAYNWAKEQGWRADNFAMQSAIYSTVNQSGGWKNGIFQVADIKSGDTTVVQLYKLYNARARYFKKLNINVTVKASIIKNRTVDELQDALKLLSEFPDQSPSINPGQSVNNWLKTFQSLFKRT